MTKPLYSKDIFIRQLTALMRRENILTWQKFEHEIGMPGATYRWRSGNDQPNPESLLKIRRRFGVSIDGLLTGEEPPGALQEHLQEPYEARPLLEIESELLYQTISVTEAVIREERYVLSPVEMARLFSRVYNDCAEDHIKPDAIMVKRYLWAMFGPRSGRDSRHKPHNPLKGGKE